MNLYSLKFIAQIVHLFLYHMQMTSTNLITNRVLITQYITSPRQLVEIIQI